MKFETFDQLFRFRPKCLCGKPVIMSFKYSSSFTSKYNENICVTPNKTHQISENGSEVLFSFNIDSSVQKTVNIDIVAYISSPDFSSTAAYTSPLIKGQRLPPIEVVKAYLTEKIQNDLNLVVVFKCSQLFQDSPCSYTLMTKPIIFDFNRGFNSTKGKIRPLELYEESFSIGSGTKTYRCRTSFEENKTVVSYRVAKPKFTIGGEESLIIPAHHFLKFPLDSEWLINKINTLVLFS